MPNFDVFSLLECKKCKSRSLGKRKSGDIKHKVCTEKRIDTFLKDLSIALDNHGRHGFRLYDGSDLKTYLLMRW